MACIWTAVQDSDWMNDNNWSGDGRPTGSGETIVPQTSTAPTNIPDQTNWTLSFEFSNDLGATFYVSSFLHDTNPAEVSSITVNHANVEVGIDADFSTNLSIVAGRATLWTDVGGESIEVSAGARLDLNGHTATPCFSFTVAGTLELSGGTINIGFNLVLQDGATVDLSGGGKIYGGIDAADGATVTWTNTNSDATDIYLNIADAVFDPGEGCLVDDNLITVHVGNNDEFDYSLPADFRCDGIDFDTTGTVTVGGAIDSPRVISVGSGDISEINLGAINGALRFRVVGDASFRWTNANALPQLEIAEGTTLTLAGNSWYISRVTNNGVLNLASYLLYLYIKKGVFWSGTGSVAGTKFLQISGSGLNGDAEALGLIDLNGPGLRFISNTHGHKIVFNGSVRCGEVNAYSATGANDVEFHGGLTADSLLFDADDFHVVLGPAKHAVSGDIRLSAGTETGCSLVLDGATLEIGGTLDGDGLSISASGSQVRGGTLTNIPASATDQMRLRCRNVTVGTGVDARLLHLDNYARRFYRRREKARLR